MIIERFGVWTWSRKHLILNTRVAPRLFSTIYITHETICHRSECTERENKVRVQAKSVKQRWMAWLLKRYYRRVPIVGPAHGSQSQPVSTREESSVTVTQLWRSRIRTPTMFRLFVIESDFQRFSHFPDELQSTTWGYNRRAWSESVLSGEGHWGSKKV